MSERQPDPALEERVVRALKASGDIRARPHWRWAAPLIAAAAAAVLLWLHPWSPPPREGQQYILLLYNNPEFDYPDPAHMQARIAEYARWADSLDRHGELDLEGRLAGRPEIGGLFIVRAKNQAEADSIAASCPHLRYHGRIEVRRFIE